MAFQAAAALLLLLSIGWSRGEYSSQSLSTFVDTLLAEYDRAAPPDSRVTVALALEVRHASVDDRTATMHLLADLNMKWNDSRLTWNASQWEGSSVVVPAERLWTPAVALASAGGAAAVMLRARATAGAVALTVRLDLAAPLALQLSDWPRDEQTATFEFASLDYKDDEIDFVINDNALSVLVESGAWQVVSVAGSRGGGAAGAAFRVRVARRGAAQAAAAGAVLAAALLLLAAAAALPYDTRAPLAAAATFLAASWLITAVFHVPAGASTPRVVWELCAACACGACCGAGAACAAGLARRTRTPPAALRALLSRVSALYALAPDPLTEGPGEKSGAWGAAARLLDAAARAALLLALLVLAAVHLFS